MKMSSTFPQFVRSFAGQWFTAMSGPLTVPFALLALFVSGPEYRTAFGALAITSGVFSSYWVWRTERQAFLSEREMRSRAELEAQSRQREDFQKEQKSLFIDILNWCNQVKRELIDIPRKNDFLPFVSALKSYDDLLPRLQLFSSKSNAVEIFSRINLSLKTFERAIYDAADGDAISNAYTRTRDDFLEVMNDLVEKMRGELGITNDVETTACHTHSS